MWIGSEYKDGIRKLCDDGITPTDQEDKAAKNIYRRRLSHK